MRSNWPAVTSCQKLNCKVYSVLTFNNLLYSCHSHSQCSMPPSVPGNRPAKLSVSECGEYKMGEAVLRSLSPPFTATLLSRYHFLLRTSSHISHVLCDMGEQLGSTRFQRLFESTLKRYKKNTGITLAQHPLAIRIQNCRSAGSVTDFLRDQIRTSRSFGRNYRIINSVKGTMSILSALSATTALEWAIGLVRQKPLTTCSVSLTIS